LGTADLSGCAAPDRQNFDGITNAARQGIGIIKDVRFFTK